MATVAIKGIDGAVEIVLGLLLAVAGTHRLAEIMLKVIAPELEQHPGNHMLQAANHGAHDLSHQTGHFALVYLLIHGVLKAGIAYNLLLEKKWIFIPAIVVLIGFILFMGVRLAQNWSLWLLALALFDMLTLALVVSEYARLGSALNRA